MQRCFRRALVACGLVVAGCWVVVAAPASLRLTHYSAAQVIELAKQHCRRLGVAPIPATGTAKYSTACGGNIVDACWEVHLEAAPKSAKLDLEVRDDSGQMLRFWDEAWFAQKVDSVPPAHAVDAVTAEKLTRQICRNAGFSDQLLMAQNYPKPYTSEGGGGYREHWDIWWVRAFENISYGSNETLRVKMDPEVPNSRAPRVVAFNNDFSMPPVKSARVVKTPDEAYDAAVKILQSWPDRHKELWRKSYYQLSLEIVQVNKRWRHGADESQKEPLSRLAWVCRFFPEPGGYADGRAESYTSIAMDSEDGKLLGGRDGPARVEPPAAGYGRFGFDHDEMGEKELALEPLNKAWHALPDVEHRPPGTPPAPVTMEVYQPGWDSTRPLFKLNSAENSEMWRSLRLQTRWADRWSTVYGVPDVVMRVPDLMRPEFKPWLWGEDPAQLAQISYWSQTGVAVANWAGRAGLVTPEFKHWMLTKLHKLPTEPIYDASRLPYWGGNY